TPVTVTITSNGQSFTYQFFVMPVEKVIKTTTVTVTKTVTVTPNLDAYYALIIVFAILFVVFAALWAVSRRKPKQEQEEQKPPEKT
ncbi:MAG: hypothetical protein QXN66_06490, partial [Thermoplasmatales archaeon]